MVKICDFGLARDIYKDPDYVRKGSVSTGHRGEWGLWATEQGGGRLEGQIASGAGLVSDKTWQHPV